MVQKIMTATLANRDIWRETHTCIQKRGVALAIRYADAASLASAVQIRCIVIWSAFRMITLCMEQAAPPCVFCCASVPVERAPVCRAQRPCVFVNSASTLAQAGRAGSLFAAPLSCEGQRLPFCALHIPLPAACLQAPHPRRALEQQALLF